MTLHIQTTLHPLHLFRSAHAQSRPSPPAFGVVPCESNWTEACCASPVPDLPFPPARGCVYSHREADVLAL
eukprot:6292358-Amphidinium_carterae.1